LNFSFDSAAILKFRGPKQLAAEPATPVFTTEQEPVSAGSTAWATTVFLTGKECPFRCLMCDLWKYTTDQVTPVGSLVQQLAAVLPQIQHREIIKLYNASNFFDPRAVPVSDLPELARLVADFHTVVVENHPKLLGPAVGQFAARLGGRLQIAMGLETSDDVILKRLNKQMGVADYDTACRRLQQQGLQIRTFVLLPAPGVPTPQMKAHTLATVRHALQQGSDVTSLIPLRGGNGVMDHLIANGDVQKPDLDTIVDTFLEAVRMGRAGGAQATVLLDLWDLDHVTPPGLDVARVRQRLQQINLSQDVAGWAGPTTLARENG
jgi:radical SAM enzyme (TIGR01210 family)